MVRKGEGGAWCGTGREVHGEEGGGRCMVWNGEGGA